MSDLPVIGAALTVPDLERHHNWLRAAPRDLELQDFMFAELLEGDWRGRVEAAKRWLDGLEGRLGLHGPFYSLPLDGWDPAVRDIMRRRLDQALDVCKALGATQLVLHSPYRSWDYNNIDRWPEARAALIERCHLTMGDAVARAESEGVTLVIENIEDRDPRDRVNLARSFGSPAVAVSLDTGHALYAHGALGAPPVDYHVLLAGELLHHIHLQDADGYADRHWAPGKGSVNWHALFAALAQTGAKPRLLLEMNDANDTIPGAEWLARAGLAR